MAGTVPNAMLTGHTSGVTYAVGQVTGNLQLTHVCYLVGSDLSALGPIKTAQLEFAGYSVASQAYRKFILHEFSVRCTD